MESPVPGFRIPTAVLRIPKRRIPDSYSCTPDSKAQDSGFHEKKISKIPKSLFLFMGRYKIWVRDFWDHALKACICCDSILSLV